ncbi:MAG TPA: TspO/MBR family protein [Armatimonadota bacterium]|nr:TspO/MBR family protein [Armatimonadota bacterium]
MVGRIVSVIIIAGFVILVAVVGSHYSVMNRDWYEALNKPSFQPPNWTFGVVWTALFILFAISLILIWNTQPHTKLHYVIMAAAVLNGILNVAWSALFFGNKLIFLAIYDAALLCLSVIFLILAAWPVSRLAGLLLIPYAIWTAFATYLTLTIYRLNGT